MPLDKSAIQSVTPSQIYAWEGLGPEVELTATTERMPSEQKWYAPTGRIVDVKVEADGDIHIALVDATGNNVGTVSAEIPVGPKWCEIRQTVFGWTAQKFPFTVKTAHTLKLLGRTSSLLPAKRFTILRTRQRIIQTGDTRRKITQCGKFIR